MKTLYGYVGRLGSGKGYCMMQEVERLKTTGNSVYLTSFADPLKQILRDSFGLEKSGILCAMTITKEYVKEQIVNTLSLTINNLEYDAFQSYYFYEIQQLVLNNYEKYEDEFYQHIVNATSNIEYDYSYRRLAQLLGTELARHIVDSIWVDIAMEKVAEVFDNELADYAFIDDCRFLNEFTAFNEFHKKTGYDVVVRGIVVPDNVRAYRRNMTMEELQAQDQHDSEREVDNLIKLISPENIIVNG